MAAITDLSDLTSLLTTTGIAQHPSFYMDNRVQGGPATAPISGAMSSLWRYNKSNGANGAIPGAAAVCDRTTLGALGQANAAAGKELWLLGMDGMATAGAGVLVLYDRLLHQGGLSGVVTTAQTVGGTITRNTGGVGNEIWLEFYTAVGATGTTVSAAYTNQAGVAKTTPLTTFGGTNYREVDRIVRLPLADGDTGVQSVQTVTVTATTAAAGSFGVTIAKPIARGLFEGGACVMYRDFLTGSPSLPKVVDDACLAFAWAAGNTSAPRLDLQLHMVAK